MTRDAIQGYIDGYLATGGNPDKLAITLDAWMKDHPVYPVDESSRRVVIDDLGSYRKA